MGEVLCQGAQPELCFLFHVVMVTVWTSLQGMPTSFPILGSLHGVRNIASQSRE